MTASNQCNLHILAIVSLLLLLSDSTLTAQGLDEDARNSMGRRLENGGSTNGATINRSSQPVISYISYLSREREWQDAKGRKMMGRLVAFSAPKPGTEGPIVVINRDQIRLRRSGAKASSDLPLASLSPADQEFVKRIDTAVRKSKETDPVSEK